MAFLHCPHRVMRRVCCSRVAMVVVVLGGILAYTAYNLRKSEATWDQMDPENVRETTKAEMIVEVKQKASKGVTNQELLLKEFHGYFMEEVTSEKNGTKTTAAMSGEARAQYLREACRMLEPRQRKIAGKYFRNTVRVSFDLRENAIFCPLCKIASTFWTRVFVMMKMKNEGNVGHSVITPFDIPSPPASKQFFNIRTQLVTPRYNAASAFKFLFVRSPYSLLISTYVDKIVGPNVYMWKEFGERAILLSKRSIGSACGNDVTFKEYIDYVIYIYLSSGNIDCHMAKFTACSPCAMNYTYVAQMETFKRDTFRILSILNQTKTVERMEQNFEDSFADDAIEDAVALPFETKSALSDCMPWAHALRRVWRKLQLRGVLGTGRFPLSDEQLTNITRSGFIDIAKQARKKTSASERKLVKKEAFYEAYSSLTEERLRKLYSIYREEMLLFGYKRVDLDLIKLRAKANNYKGFFDFTKEISHNTDKARVNL